MSGKAEEGGVFSQILQLKRLERTSGTVLYKSQAPRAPTAPPTPRLEKDSQGGREVKGKC